MVDDQRPPREEAALWVSAADEREMHKRATPSRQNTNATSRGGSSRSSYEVLVMRMERRTRVTQVRRKDQLVNYASRNIF